MAPTFKKGTRSDCSKGRDISLISIRTELTSTRAAPTKWKKRLQQKGNIQSVFKAHGSIHKTGGIPIGGMRSVQ